jgi:GNAT superfamily N-acetyltransferase
MTRTTIRKARARDCADLTRIAHRAKRFWGYPKKLMRLWGDTLTITPEFVSSHQVYCAARGADLLGFYALSISGATCELEHMWVAPEHMRAGVGHLLFAHLRKRVAVSGAMRLRIASDPHAEGFYRRMGARRVGKEASRPAGRFLPVLVLRTVSPR